jgi:hypothetical protein
MRPRVLTTCERVSGPAPRRCAARRRVPGIRRGAQGGQPGRARNSAVAGVAGHMVFFCMRPIVHRRTRSGSWPAAPGLSMATLASGGRSGYSGLLASIKRGWHCDSNQRVVCPGQLAVLPGGCGLGSNPGTARTGCTAAATLRGKPARRWCRWRRMPPRRRAIGPDAGPGAAHRRRSDRRNGLILTIGYLILETDQIDIRTVDRRTYPARVVAYDTATAWGCCGRWCLWPMSSRSASGRWPPQRWADLCSGPRATAREPSALRA